LSKRQVIHTAAESTGGVKSPDAALPESELAALAEEALLKYPQLIFKIVLSKELHGYYPSYAEKDRALQAFRGAMGDSAVAKQVLNYFDKAEKDRYIRKGAREDRELAELIKLLRGKREIPLMAELPYSAAYELWRRAGSWTGALTLAGIEPLRERLRLKALRRYAAVNASAANLPGNMRGKLSEETLDMLSRLCAVARRLRRAPSPRELPEGLLRNLRKRIRSEGCSPNTVLSRAGVEYPPR
jgi:hypothetical protein